MLQNLREHVQGWIAGVIASVLCLAFALWGVEYYLNNGTAQVMVAKVDGDGISQAQLDAAYSRARQAQRMQPADPARNEVFQQQIKQRALNGLIQQHVLTHAAEKAGYFISPAQVGATLQQMPAFQVGGQFSIELFERALAELSYTPAAFAQDIAKSSLLQQVQRSLADSNFALPADLNQYIALQDQKRDFGYLLISPTNFLATAAVSEQAIQQYYAAHSKDYTLPEQVSLQYLWLSTDQASKKMVIAEQELRQYYEENRRSFAPPPQWRVARILLKAAANANSAPVTKLKAIAAQLAAGKDFANLAARYSEDMQTAVHGGDLGWLTRAQQPALVQAVSRLQPGQVSAPVQTSEGWNLLKLIAVKTPPPPAYLEVKPQIEKSLRQQKLDQWAAGQSDKLANLTYTHPETLKIAADALDVPIQTTALFTQQGQKTGLLANPKILAAAFSDTVLKQRNNSDVIAVDDHTLVVVRLADYKPAVVQPLAQVRSVISHYLKQQSAQAAANALGEKIVQAMRKGIAPQVLASSNKLTWQQSAHTSRLAKDVPAEILNLAFSQPAPSSAEKPVVQGKQLADGKYMVLALTQVAAGSGTALDAAHRALLQKQMATSFGALDYALYLAQQINVAKIKIVLAPAS